MDFWKDGGRGQVLLSAIIIVSKIAHLIMHLENEYKLKILNLKKVPAFWHKNNFILASKYLRVGFKIPALCCINICS
jgi:hypothetical protein